MSPAAQTEAAEFTLDTSGEVRMPYPVPEAPDAQRVVRWQRDLDPFTQGYVEALFASERPYIKHDGLWRYPRERECRFAGFSDLHHSALAAILADCAENTREFLQPHGFPEVARNNGRHFWRFRRAGFWPNRWPPLTVSLGDDGRVNLTTGA